MQATNVRNLKKNPSAMLRQAEVSPVLVLKGDEPNAFIVHIEKTSLKVNCLYVQLLPLHYLKMERYHWEKQPGLAHYLYRIL